MPGTDLSDEPLVPLALSVQQLVLRFQLLQLLHAVGRCGKLGLEDS